MNTFPHPILSVLETADVKLNGTRPWDLQIHNDAFYARVLRGGTLGFGESYVDGWWDCERLDELIARLVRADARSALRPNAALIWSWIVASVSNRQKGRRTFRVGETHYDAGNDLYRAMLDARLTYTCGYWSQATTLDEAQEAKLDLVCRKIGLKAGQRVLDIGCGWGSFASFAAERYGASVVGITISKEQATLARERCKGLPVEIFLQDYRHTRSVFDHIVSLGMFEHVGYKNYRTYMSMVRRCLAPDGIFLLHTIGGNQSVRSTDPWIEKYIFPNSMLPSAAQITRAAEGLFVMEDWHSFGTDYDKTLMAWDANFERAWPSLRETYGDRFFRLWRFYLLSCAGSFRARQNQLWQIVFSPHGIPGGYQSVR